MSAAHSRQDKALRGMHGIRLIQLLLNTMHTDNSLHPSIDPECKECAEKHTIEAIGHFVGALRRDCYASLIVAPVSELCNAAELDGRRATRKMMSQRFLRDDMKNPLRSIQHSLVRYRTALSDDIVPSYGRDALRQEHCRGSVLPLALQCAASRLVSLDACMNERWNVE